MENTVKQHYVPRFYLRGFSSPTRPNAVYAYRLSERKRFGPILVDHVGHENHFYDLDDATSLEDAFANLENQVAIVHRKILETRDLSRLSASELALYAYFVAAQNKRTRRARNDVRMALNLMADVADLPDRSAALRKHIRQTGGEALEAFESELPSLIDKLLNDAGLFTEEHREANRSKARVIALKMLDDYRESLEKGQLPRDVQQGMREAAADPTSVKRLHINAIPVTASRAAQSLISMRWYLWSAESEEPLLTSDNPVIVLDDSFANGSPDSLPNLLGYSDWNKSPGNLKPSLRILMPLSPSLMLLISPTANLQIQALDEKGVAALNSLVAVQASDFLYSATDDFGSAMPGVALGPKSRETLEGIRRLVLSKVRRTTDS